MASKNKGHGIDIQLLSRNRVIQLDHCCVLTCMDMQQWWVSSKKIMKVKINFKKLLKNYINRSYLYEQTHSALSLVFI